MGNLKQKIIIGVIGGHSHNTNTQALKLAEKTGEVLAQKRLTVVCGGEDGIMEAVCKGCKNFNGTTIGIIKSNKKSMANKYIDYIIPTSMDLAFMNVLIWTADGIIAFDGKYGTMTEVGLALDIGKPLVTLGAHNLINKKEIDSLFVKHYENYNQENISEIIDDLVIMINKFDRYK